MLFRSVSVERAIIYFTKERVRNFIRRELSANELLSDAVIFAVEDDGPLNLVSFRPQESQRDFRPAIREDNLAAVPVAPTAGEILVETAQRAPAKAAEPAAPIAKPEVATPPAAPAVISPVIAKASESVKPEQAKLAAPQNYTSAKVPVTPKLAIETKLPEAVAAPRVPDGLSGRAPEQAVPPAVVIIEPQRIVEVKPLAPSNEKPAGEQLALLKNKPPEVAPAKSEVARSAPKAPKALEGFIIQLAFNDKEKARRWAEAMEKRGYAVSLTEAGSEGSLRVRLGNFSVRDEAERQLRTLKQDGLNGIVISLPQAFRPEARTSIP